MASELQPGRKECDEGGEEESAVASKQIKWGSNSSGTQRTYVSTVTVVCFYRQELPSVFGALIRVSLGFGLDASCFFFLFDF
jgi:hypothetical protein